MTLRSVLSRRRMKGPVMRLSRALAPASRAAGGVLGEGGPRAPRAVMDEHGQGGREALRLLRPVPDDRGRTDEERRTPRALRPALLHEGQRLYGLAEAHVVGEAGAEAALA